MVGVDAGALSDTIAADIDAVVAAHVATLGADDADGGADDHGAAGGGGGGGVAAAGGSGQHAVPTKKRKAEVVASGTGTPRKRGRPARVVAPAVPAPVPVSSPPPLHDREQCGHASAVARAVVRAAAAARVATRYGPRLSAVVAQVRFSRVWLCADVGMRARCALIVFSVLE